MCFLHQNGALYLGAVGAYDWSGTVIKYDSSNDEEASIPSYEEVQRVLPDRAKESYLGSSCDRFLLKNMQFEERLEILCEIIAIFLKHCKKKVSVTSDFGF